jgi:hypothetical protein
MSFLQNYPRVLELAYLATLRGLTPFRRWLRPGGSVERIFILAERATKGPLFDCRMCGQCVLHQTGMTCPMTCPKEMRNGPCGGVRLDGTCEVIPGMLCPWVLAWKRAEEMPVHGVEIERILPPLDRRRIGTSAWINDLPRPPSMIDSEEGRGVTPRPSTMDSEEGRGVTLPPARGIFHGADVADAEAQDAPRPGRR